MLAALAALFAAIAVPQPTIVQKPIPFPAKRKQEMRAYAKRHYGIDSYRLRDPKVIVEHYTVTSTFQQTWNTFAPDKPDPELHELPGTCAHDVIDKDGTIYQLVPRSIMCRHTVGLNYTAIGIEHVGSSDAQVLSNASQMAASLRLTRWLRCRYSIDVKNVIGHAESLSSPYHSERVERLKTQTHGDMSRSTMRTYRSKLARKGSC
jgi:N-acetylmuramoyl-L-alanine amidase